MCYTQLRIMISISSNQDGKYRPHFCCGKFQFPIVEVVNDNGHYAIVMIYFKKRKRIKYNWIHIINEMGLCKAFDEFVHKRDFEAILYHKKTISLNRHARAFVLHYRRLLPADFSWAIKGKETAAPSIENFN